MTIWDLETKIVNSVPLEADEMLVVEEAIGSAEASERILASEALLRMGCAREKERAKLVIKGLLREANSGTRELTANVIMALFSLPAPVLEEPEFKAALTRAASHADDGVRGNCMIALVTLVKEGNTWAEDLLRGGLRDSSPEVRQNARSALDFLSSSS